MFRSRAQMTLLAASSAAWKTQNICIRKLKEADSSGVISFDHFRSWKVQAWLDNEGNF